MFQKFKEKNSYEVSPVFKVLLRLLMVMNFIFKALKVVVKDNYGYINYLIFVKILHEQRQNKRNSTLEQA